MIKIETNSKMVKPGDTFVAIKGFTVDGHKFIKNAVEAGATTVVCEYIEEENPNVNYIVVPDTKAWLSNELLSKYGKYINDNLTFTGVTGTNGKTTTCFLTYETLEKMGVDACYIGTIGYYDKDTHKELPNTTPNILELYKMFDAAISKGITHVVMEVSSHSLVEKRIEGIEFTSEGFTNLTQDHLDFHKTMEEYEKAKLLILDQLKEDGAIVVNQDDAVADDFRIKDNLSYGFNGYDLKILDYIDTKEGTSIRFNYNGKEYTVNTKLKNRFNVYNYLMSVLLITNLGYSLDEVLTYSDEILPPSGRCDIVPFGDKDIVIDYAHTPDAVLKIITSFSEVKDKGRILTLVGCGGDRDKTKRPVMGNIATENSDYVIITSDNPRTEDPNEIIKDIVAGITKDNYTIVPDRIEAIHTAIDMMEDDDVLLVLGKGHEDYQIIGKEKIHLDDKEEVKKYIKK